MLDVVDSFEDVGVPGRLLCIFEETYELEEELDGEGLCKFVSFLS